MIGALTNNQIPVQPVTDSLPETAEKDLTKLKETAGQIVGQAFYGTLFKMMRDSSLKTETYYGGRGEEVFGAQLHGIYAERLGTVNNPITQSIYDHYEDTQKNLSLSRVNV